MHKVKCAEQHERLAALGQHLLLDDQGDAAITLEELLGSIGNVWACEPVPIDRRIASKHSESLPWRQFLVDRADEREELFEEPGCAAHRLRRVAPNFLNFGEGYGISCDVTV